MSAHVVPKAKPFSQDDPEEKTTLEPQWEEEASTTVEQGEVADKIRALGVEPLPRVITNVTSTGASSLEESTVDDQRANPMIAAIAPVPDVARLVITQGTDTGRDLEIRPGKAYTIGRGLDSDLVLTDIAVSRKHFDLRHEAGAWVIVDRGSGNGTIVNGNFEDNPFLLANGDTIEIGNTMFRFEQANGAARPPPQLDSDDDVDDEELSTVAGKPLRHEVVDSLPTPVRHEAPRERPKTLPPPAPMRAPSGPSAPPYAAGLPASTLPLPQMANRGPVLAPGQPTMLGDAQGLPVPPMPGVMPTTLPGQPAPMRLGGYPQATEIPPHSVHAQMLLIAAAQGRADPSTAHVQPSPFNPMPAAVQLRQYVQPQLSKRTKMILAGAGLAGLAAIITIAILNSGGGSAKPNVAATAGTPAAGSATAGTAKAGSATQIQVQPIKPPPLPAPTLPRVAKSDPPQPVAKADPPKADPPKVDPPKANPPKADPPKADPPHPIAHADTPKATPRATPTPAPPVAHTPTPVVAARPKHTPTPAPPRHVATADIDGATARADAAYRAKRFSDAANILAEAARSASDDDARKLRHKADLYEKFRRAYNAGTEPAAKATDAFRLIREAIGYDNALGHAFDGELNGKLGQVAPKAAIAFMAEKDYKDAHTALVNAESLGGQNDNTQLVRQALDARARDAYNTAERERDSNVDDARDKCHKVLDWVDSKSQWYMKAKKLLQQLGS